MWSTCTYLARLPVFQLGVMTYSDMTAQSPETQAVVEHEIRVLLKVCPCFRKAQQLLLNLLKGSVRRWKTNCKTYLHSKSYRSFLLWSLCVLILCTVHHIWSLVIKLLICVANPSLAKMNVAHNDGELPFLLSLHLFTLFGVSVHRSRTNAPKLCWSLTPKSTKNWQKLCSCMKLWMPKRSSRSWRARGWRPDESSEQSDGGAVVKGRNLWAQGSCNERWMSRMGHSPGKCTGCVFMPSLLWFIPR